MKVDEAAIERPPYTGLHQWMANKGVPTKNPAVPSKRSFGVASQGPDSQNNSRKRTASSYSHTPVHQSQSSNASRGGTANPQEQPRPWHLPPQQVCKEGAQPTAVCGRWSPATRAVPKKPQARAAGPFRCPRCLFGYSKPKSVRTHFPKCIALNGNPNCDSWTDHHSYNSMVAAQNAHVLVQSNPRALI